MKSPIIYNHLKNNFSQISNHALLDITLSAKAYKLYAYMCYRIGLSDSWQFNTYEILKHFKEGDKAMRVAFKELIDAGFLERKRVRNEKGIFERTDYTIYAEPINTASDPQVQNRRVDNRRVENPPVDNAALNNKEGINKDKNNKELSLSSAEKIWKELKERENFDFEIDLKKAHDWYMDQGNMKISFKNFLKTWAAKPENQIRQKTSQSKTEPEEILRLRQKIQSQLGFAKSYLDFFAGMAIEKTSSGFIIKVTDPRALGYQEILNSINVKIEVKP